MTCIQGMLESEINRLIFGDAMPSEAIGIPLHIAEQVITMVHLSNHLKDWAWDAIKATNDDLESIVEHTLATTQGHMLQVRPVSVQERTSACQLIYWYRVDSHTIGYAYSPEGEMLLECDYRPAGDIVQGVDYDELLELIKPLTWPDSN